MKNVFNLSTFENSDANFNLKIFITINFYEMYKKNCEKVKKLFTLL